MSGEAMGCVDANVGDGAEAAAATAGMLPEGRAGGAELIRPDGGKGGGLLAGPDARMRAEGGGGAEDRAAGMPDVDARLAATCVGCEGRDGRATGPVGASLSLCACTPVCVVSSWGLFFSSKTCVASSSSSQSISRPGFVAAALPLLACAYGAGRVAAGSGALLARGGGGATAGRDPEGRCEAGAAAGMPGRDAGREGGLAEGRDDAGPTPSGAVAGGAGAPVGTGAATGVGAEGERPAAGIEPLGRVLWCWGAGVVGGSSLSGLADGGAGGAAPTRGAELGEEPSDGGATPIIVRFARSRLDGRAAGAGADGEATGGAAGTVDDDGDVVTVIGCGGVGIVTGAATGVRIDEAGGGGGGASAIGWGAVFDFPSPSKISRSLPPPLSSPAIVLVSCCDGTGLCPGPRPPSNCVEFIVCRFLRFPAKKRAGTLPGAVF